MRLPFFLESSVVMHVDANLFAQSMCDWNGFQWRRHGVRCFPLRLQTRQPVLHADQDSAHRAVIG